MARLETCGLTADAIGVTEAMRRCSGFGFPMQFLHHAKTLSRTVEILGFAFDELDGFDPLFF